MMRKSVVSAALLVLALAHPAAHATEAGATISGELQRFFREYLSVTKAEAPRFNLPAIWVYNPSGNLVARIDAEADIQRFGDLLKDADAASLSSLKLDQLSQITAKIGAPFPATEEGQWTALLLSSDDCHAVCSGIRARLKEAQRANPGLVRIVDFTLRR